MCGGSVCVGCGCVGEVGMGRYVGKEHSTCVFMCAYVYIHVYTPVSPLTHTCTFPPPQTPQHTHTYVNFPCIASTLCRATSASLLAAASASSCTNPARVSTSPVYCCHSAPSSCARSLHCTARPLRSSSKATVYIHSAVLVSSSGLFCSVGGGWLGCWYTHTVVLVHLYIFGACTLVATCTLLHASSGQHPPHPLKNTTHPT